MARRAHQSVLTNDFDCRDDKLATWIGGALREDLGRSTYFDAGDARIGGSFLVHLKRQAAGNETDLPRLDRGIGGLVPGHARPQAGAPRQVGNEVAAVVSARRPARRSVRDAHARDREAGGVIDHSTAGVDRVDEASDDRRDEQDDEGKCEVVAVADQGTVCTLVCQGSPSGVTKYVRI